MNQHQQTMRVYIMDVSRITTIIERMQHDMLELIKIQSDMVHADKDLEYLDEIGDAYEALNDAQQSLKIFEKSLI